MPIKKSAMKALRQAKKRTLRNAKVKSGVEFLRREVRKAIEDTDAKKAVEVAKQLVKSLDKAVQNNVIKQNTGSRLKSRLMLKINKLTAK